MSLQPLVDMARVRLLLLHRRRAQPLGKRALQLSPLQRKARNTRKIRGGAGAEVGSGAGDVGKGAAKGAGDLAKGTGKGAVDLATLHPVDAATDIGKGAGKAGGHVAVGTAKGTGKVVKGTAKAIKKVF